MGFQRNLKTNKGFSFIELLIVLSLMGTGTMFVLKNYQDKTNTTEGKNQASQILLFLDAVKSFDPAENYKRKAGSYPLSPDEQTFVDNALATGFNDLSPDFIDYQIKMAFGEEKRTTWKAPISATTDVQEFSIITGLPKNTRGCLSFLSELSKPPVHSVGYSGGIYKTSSDKPNEFVSICSNISGKKFKKVSINYCNFLDGKDCSNKP